MEDISVTKSNEDLYGTSNQDQGIKIQNIVFRPLVRQSQDIQKWRNALIYAESMVGIRVPLYELYSDIELDPVLSNLKAKRILGVTKNKLVYLDKDGKEVDNVMKVLNTYNFRQLRKEIQLYKFDGKKVIELILEDGKFRFFAPDRRNIRPRQGKIVFEQYGSDGILYREGQYPKYVFEVGEDEDLGLLLKAAPLVIYKRGSLGDWSQFSELFGMPFRKATWDGFNEATRIQLEDAMERAGSAAYAVLPEGTTMEFLEAKSTTNSSKVYDDLRKACNEEMSILILGQSQTTQKTQGSLGGNDDTHEKTEDEINEDDRMDELAIMNERVKPILINLGLMTEDGGSFSHHEGEEDLEPKDAVDMAIKMKQAGTPVDDDTMYQISRIAKPANYAAIKTQMEAEKQEQIEAMAQEHPPMDEQNPKKGGKKANDKTNPKKNPAKLSFMDSMRQTLSDFFDPAH